MESTSKHLDDQQLIAVLHQRGQRVTPQRLLINRALGELERHVTAEEVLESVEDRLPNVSLPTVYSTLELFEDLDGGVELDGAVFRAKRGGFVPTRAEVRINGLCADCARGGGR